jgi:hypothetical protein
MFYSKQQDSKKLTHEPPVRTDADGPRDAEGGSPGLDAEETLCGFFCPKIP